MKITLDVLQAGEEKDLLDLLRKNLKGRLDAQTANEQGFLTFEYSVEEILLMKGDMPQPVARSEEEIVGYALAVSKDTSLSIKLLSTMKGLTDNLTYCNGLLKDKNYYFMGQICIANGHRGQGIFDRLYLYHKELFSNSYDCVVTEISTLNTRSMRAHLRVGFEVIHLYKDVHTQWAVVAWDWK